MDEKLVKELCVKTMFVSIIYRIGKLFDFQFNI